MQSIILNVVPCSTSLFKGRLGIVGTNRMQLGSRALQVGILGIVTGQMKVQKGHCFICNKIHHINKVNRRTNGPKTQTFSSYVYNSQGGKGPKVPDMSANSFFTVSLILPLYLMYSSSEGFPYPGMQ